MRALTPRSVRLAERMRVSGAAAMAGVPEAELADLRLHIRQLRALLGGAGAGAGVAPDRLREQVALFRETGRLPDVRAARFVCWGTTLADQREPALIEDRERFPVLIDEVDSYRTDRRPYRRCWRGLLNGYLSYDPDAGRDPGRRNWGILREYLNDNLPGLDRGTRTPDWLATVDDHANILGEDPCGRYGAELLEGDGEVLVPLRRDLSISDDSWMMRRIFDAQIEAAVAFGDARLRSALPRLVALIGEHPLLADDGLSRILDRYSRSANLDVEPELRDLAVGRWGNPWLERNDTKWEGVFPETRRMVSSWLKLSLIEKFFGLLSEDRLNDQRRIEFWKRHVDRISDMYFALGDAAYRNPSSDFRDLRKAMHGRMLRLDNGGGAQNNAFIMRMYDCIFVEFGEKGNAMYAFDASKAPFDLRGSSIAGNKTALKHPNHLARMTHTDGGAERWERKLDRKIQDLLGKRSVAPPSMLPTGTRAAPVIPVTMPRASPPASVTASALSITLAKYDVKTEDHREKGGSLWAYAPQRGAAGDDLRRLGFTWSVRRSAWYMKS